jgi:hypothetical protein
MASLANHADYYSKAEIEFLTKEFQKTLQDPNYKRQPYRRPQSELPESDSDGDLSSEKRITSKISSNS